MASFWFWLLLVIGSLALGTVVTAAVYFFYDYMFKKFFLKKPKDKKEFLDPGMPPKIDIKEEKERERKRLAKFREFEKLRRVAAKRSGDQRPESKPDAVSRTGKTPEREILPPQFGDDTAGDQLGDAEDEQGFNFHRPTDLRPE